MLNIIEFRRDLKRMSLDETLRAYNLTLSEVMEALTQPSNTRLKTVDKPRFKTVDKHVYQRGNFYHISKSINNRTREFGHYTSLKDAIMVRDYLIKHGWTIKARDKALKEYGIIMR